MSSTLLRIRSGQENERGPLYMEPAIASLHSLKGKDQQVGLEVGSVEGKIALFIRASEGAAQLAESQLYAQYPDVDIERARIDPLALGEGEEAVSLDLLLTDPEVFPIKRHPQFDDLLTRVNVDSIAGITSTLSRYNIPGMRGHVQVIMKPIRGGYRRRAIRFLPLLTKGISSASQPYQRFFARVQLARGWKKYVYMPVSILMGGFRAWPGFSKFGKGALSLSTGEVSHSSDPEEEEIRNASARSHDREDPVAASLDKVNRLLFLCNVRLTVICPKGQKAEALKKLTEMVGSFSQFSLPQSNAFKPGKVHENGAISHSFLGSPYILSTEEIATLWHLPTILVQTPNLDWVLSRKLEPPVDLPVPGHTDKEHDLTILGEAVFRGARTRFGIRNDDRRRHIYTLGKTGMGKSTLLENMVFSDIHAGRGVGVIDPHGDLIDAIIQFIPKSRSNDVVIFDPADRDYPISFNILECQDKNQRVLVASGIMSVFTKLWPDVWSGRMDHILRNTLLALWRTRRLPCSASCACTQTMCTLRKLSPASVTLS